MMKMIVLAPLALFATSPAVAQVMTPNEYVKAAGASDLFERQSAQIVLETTANPMVRDFATMMLKAHSESTAKVKAAAAKSKVPAAQPSLTPTQAEKVAELRAESGAARDSLYIAQQKAAHGQALSAQQAYATGGNAALLKETAAGIVPVVKMHIRMLMAM